MAWPWNLGLESFKVMYNFLLLRHCNYSSILYHLRVIWRWIIPWPSNLAQRSLKVIETGAIRKLGCGFLFAFYSNYGDNLYRLRDIATYWYKSRDFYTPPVFSAPTGCDPIGISWRRLMLVKLEWLGYCMVKKNYDNMLSRFHPILERYGRTDRRTDRQMDGWMDGRTDKFAISISHWNAINTQATMLNETKLMLASS